MRWKEENLFFPMNQKSSKKIKISKTCVVKRDHYGSTIGGLSHHEVICDFCKSQIPGTGRETDAAAQLSGGVWACFWMFSLPSARGRNDFSYYFISMQSFRAQELRPSGRGWCAVARCRGGRLGSVRWPEIAQNALQTV